MPTNSPEIANTGTGLTFSSLCHGQVCGSSVRRALHHHLPGREDRRRESRAVESSLPCHPGMPRNHLPLGRHSIVVIGAASDHPLVLMVFAKPNVPPNVPMSMSLYRVCCAAG